MKISRAAKRYARAFFQFSEEHGQLDAARADLAAIRRLLEECDEFDSFVHNPVIPDEQRQSVMQGLLGDHAHPGTIKFLQFLISKGRLDTLGAVCRVFEEEYCRKHNIQKVTVTSAAPLMADQIQSIHDRLEQRFQKTIDAETKIDPSLLGGFKVQVGDTIHDYSIQAQLQRLRNELINA